MRPAPGQQLTRCLVAGAAALILCSCPRSSRASEPALVVWLDGGEGRSYALAVIERVSFAGDTLHVIASGGTHSHPLESILRIDFELSGWTGVDSPEAAGEVMGLLHLFQNRPNPFSPGTQIAFELPRAGRVDLKIHAVNGRVVRTLVSEYREAGRHDLSWDGHDDLGGPVASGVYFYSLVAAGVEESRKMILLR